jgi:predicted DNA-binding transcriptional regulator YafY
VVASWFREREAHDENVRLVREFDDGGLEAVVTGRLASNGDAHELMSFLLGLGPNVEVLEPQEIRDRVARELTTATERSAWSQSNKPEA